jgi:DNA-binding transcriptional MerR regulator
LYYPKLSLSLALEMKQSGVAMETNPQYETGHWLRHSTARRDDKLKMPEIQSDSFPETEESSRLYTIREMARDFQVSIRTLRFYEDRGLLHPRREGTNRRYDSRDRLHLRMILKGKSLGFTLSEIHDILVGRGENSGKMDLETGLLPEQIAAQIDYLERQRSQIDEAISTLRKAQSSLFESSSRSAPPAARSGQ